MFNLGWNHVGTAARAQYLCGYCGSNVGPNQSYQAHDQTTGRVAYIFICPTCSNPTYIDPAGKQTPAPRLGAEVKGISDAGVQTLYNEARDCTAAGAYTAAVMVCRKILMHVAVQQKAKPDEKFAYYVDYLDKNHFIPPGGKRWVDAIRQKGNEANHEIVVMTEADAQQIMAFVEHFLRTVYELPSMLPPVTP
jgi:hypothetical protein